MANFETSQEIFDAGFAIQTFNIMSDAQNWRYRNENYKTFSVPSAKKLDMPRITIAPVEDVRKAAI